MTTASAPSWDKPPSVRPSGPLTATCTPAVDINPGSGNLGVVFFNQQLQINNNNQVIAEDTLGSAQKRPPLETPTRRTRYTYVARAGSGQQFTALYGAPSLNKTSNAVYAAIQGSTTSLYEAISGKKTAMRSTPARPNPSVANNGSIVITSTSHATGLNEITLFTSGFASQVDIADGSNFSYLDTAPGLSADGNIVVFQGTLTASDPPLSISPPALASSLPSIPAQRGR